LGLGAAAAAQAPAYTLVLPQRVVAGQRATLAVLDAEGRIAPGVSVEFSGGLTVNTDATGRAMFTAPEQTGVLTARVPDRGGSAAAMVIQPAANPPDGVVLDDVPQIIPLQDRCTILGWGFRPEADANNVTLGEQPALVLAASPVSLAVVPSPRAAPGPAQLQVEVGGRNHGPVSVTLIAIELAADKPRLAPKEKGTLTVRIRGAWQRLELDVRNLTPDVVKLAGGDAQRIISSGGTDNTAVLELQGKREGEFHVSVRLVPLAAGLPDTQTALKNLLLAVRLAPATSVERLQRLIHDLERHPQEASKVRLEIERMLAENPQGEYAKALEGAWLALLKR
jgi:hypothetical protein